jgi:hypothetical protein
MPVFHVELYATNNEKDEWKRSDKCDDCTEHHKHVYLHVEATSLMVMLDESEVLVCMKRSF